MIEKIYRLKEREVKKVLTKWKPFFSYGIVLNSASNRLDYNRFAIVIWTKSVNTNITRNFFRRRFYDFVRLKIEALNWKWSDFVFVVKKQTKLDKKSEKSIKDFVKDLAFLTKNI